MPLGGIVSRRFCGAWTIGNPGSPVSHSRPLESLEGSCIPYRPKSVLESILRAVVASLLVSAHTHRSVTRPAEMSSVGWVLSVVEGCRGFRIFSVWGSRFGSRTFSDWLMLPDSQMSLGRQGLPDRQLSPSPHSQTVLRCNLSEWVGIVHHVRVWPILVLVAGFAFWLLTGE